MSVEDVSLWVPSPKNHSRKKTSPGESVTSVNNTYRGTCPVVVLTVKSIFTGTNVGVGVGVGVSFCADTGTIKKRVPRIKIITVIRYFSAVIIFPHRQSPCRN